MTAEPWWRCQEAASSPFINCHHHKPRLPLSRLQGTCPFMDSSRMYFSSFSPSPGAGGFLKEERKAHLPGSSRVGVASYALAKGMEDAGGLRSFKINVC